MQHCLRLAAFGLLQLLGALSLAYAADAYPDVKIEPAFTNKGELRLPTDFRRWVFIGAPLTPHALNNEAAGFPEYHNVYVQPEAYDYYLRHGSFPEGTVLVKELQLTKERAFPDGSRLEASGRGFFPGTPNGLDVSVKDSKRFAATSGWGFFNFGHHAPPYEASATLAALESCASCHQANAHEDMVFTGFYLQLKPLPTGKPMDNMK